MKRILYTLVVFCAVGFLSCRKSDTDISIKQFDDNQMQNYIKANGLNMKLDTSGKSIGADTSGIYYQIITPGTGANIEYSKKIAFLYSVKSLDGAYSSTDTLLNHSYNFPAYIGPGGLQLAIKNIMKTKGTKARFLIPSRLAYGVNGTTISRYTSLSTVTTVTVGGNQCLDFTVTVLDDDINPANQVDKIALYDDITIKKYMASKGLTGYLPVDPVLYKGVYYKITTAGTGTAVIPGSVLGVQLTGYLLNPGDAVFTQAVADNGAVALNLIEYKDSIVEGLYGALLKAKAGDNISVLIPSKYGYGLPGSTSSTGLGVLPFSCFRFDVSLITVTN